MWSPAMIRPVLLIALMVGPAGLADAACYGPDQRIDPQKVVEFNKDPAAYVQSLEATGNTSAEISALRDLVASDPSTLSGVIGLLSRAIPSQQTTIGTALGQAVNMCVIPDPTYAADIQIQLAAAKSDAANTAYAAVTGNRPIGSVANGGVGGGPSTGGVGGSTGGTNGSTGAGAVFQSLSTVGVNNTTTSFFAAGTGSASSAGSTTSAATSVSP
ncbi:hypothetical protein ACVIIW_003631 [Bradyrhizobium sp. USDA 4449]